MLAVVEHEERAPVGERLGDGRDGRLASRVLQAERVGHGVGDALGLTDRGQQASQTPSGKRRSKWAVTSVARRVLPLPPGPVRVISPRGAGSGSSSATSAGQFRLPPEEGRARSGRVTRRPHAKIGEHSVTFAHGNPWASGGHKVLHYTPFRAAYVPPWKAVTAAVACMLAQALRWAGIATGAG